MGERFPFETKGKIVSWSGCIGFRRLTCKFVKLFRSFDHFPPHSGQGYPHGRKGNSFLCETSTPTNFISTFCKDYKTIVYTITWSETNNRILKDVSSIEAANGTPEHSPNKELTSNKDILITSPLTQANASCTFQVPYPCAPHTFRTATNRHCKF